MPVSSSTEHWIKQDALTINLNHFGDPDYLQVSILAGTVVMAFRKDVIGYNASHNYRTWPLQAANTYLETSSAVNVYARLTRSEVNALALIVYDTVLRDIEGREISYDENGNELLGESDPSFFYVFVGQISESLDRDGNKKPRAWNRSLVYGTLDSSEQKNYSGLLWEMMFTPHFDNPLNPDELTWIEAKKHLGVSGGVTMFVNNGNLNLPSIYDGLPIDNNTIYWENGILKAKGGGGIAESVSWADITGKPEWLLDGKISYSEIEGTPDLSVYALKRSLSEYVTKTELTNLDYADKDWVKEYVVDINTGNITAITKQMVIEALGYTPYDDTNPNGYVTSESIPSLAGYATEDWVNKKGYLTSIPSEYITETELTNKGYATTSDLDSRINALINGAPDAYDTLQEIADVLQGNVNSIGDILTALGGKADKAKTLSGYGITDAYTKTEVNTLLNDNATQTWVKNQGYLTQHQDLSGYQKLITSSNKLAYSLISGTPTALKNPTALKFGTKSYDGSVEQTILASDLGALTSHQVIYTLTFQSGTFASGSFTANSGNKTINIPTTTSHVSEGSNLYFTNARAVSALGDTLKSYVTLSGSQTVSGEKNFTGGFKVNGSPIVYDAAKKYWKLEGDLLITGGLTMYGSDSSFTPSTIMDAIAVDGTTISKDGGVLRVIGGGSGSISEITKQMVIDALGFTPISSSDMPTVLPNPHSLKFGSKLYDGSASKTILASDLGITWDDILGRPTLLSSFTDDVVAGKYLPLTGGTIISTGRETLLLRSSNSYGPVLDLQDSKGNIISEIGHIPSNASNYNYGAFWTNIESKVGFVLGNDGIAYVTTNPNTLSPKYTIWHEGNFTPANYLPLSGGTISGFFAINGSNASYTQYKVNNAVKGEVGWHSNYGIFIKNETSKKFLNITDEGLAQFDGNSLIHSGNVSSQIVEGITTHVGDATNANGDIAKLNSYYSSQGFRISRFNGLNGLGTKNQDGLIVNWPLDRSYGQQWYIDDESHTIQTRYVSGGAWSDWKTIAFTDSNVASATKLQTPRTIWGQSFDGTGNIDGMISINDGWGIKNTTQGWRLLTDGHMGDVISNGGVELYSSKGVTLSAGSVAKSLHLNSAGNVGIGTTTPESKLHVEGNITLKNNSSICVKDSNGTARYILGLTGSNNLVLGQTSSSAGYNTLIDGNNIKLRYGTTQTEGIVLTSSGNVGIGVGSPSRKLHIVMSNDNVLIYDNGRNESSIVFQGLDNKSWIVGKGCGNTGDTFTVYNGTTGKNALLINKSNNVGINVASPTEKLHVDGNILTTGGITMYSQRSLKNVVDERGLSLDELRTIKPTRYTWKDGRDDRIHFGGIADDIQQVLPEVVYNADGTLTMDYGNAGFAIASSLIKPVVDHEQRIKALEKENEELKKRLNRYEA